MALRSVTAHVSFLKIAPRKVRLVAQLVRGLTVPVALTQLSVLRKQSVDPMRKLIDSACANARQRFELKPEQMMIKTLTVDEGPKLKRFRPRAFGRAAGILKRSSHIHLTLTERVENAPQKPLTASTGHPRALPGKKESEAKTHSSGKDAKPHSSIRKPD